MEIFVIHREFVNGHIDIAGPAFTNRADAETHQSDLLSLEEVQDVTIHSVYLTLDSPVSWPVSSDYLYGVTYKVSSHD